MRKLPVIALIISLALGFTPAWGGATSAEEKMVLVKTITGKISPKSVLASNSGLISAHNMMYSHSVTIYDANKAEIIATVPDTVYLGDFGYSKYSGLYRGAPVEGAFSPDGKYLYFTNYAMYGKGFTKETPARPHQGMTAVFYRA
jgi:hypothetical protein